MPPSHHLPILALLLLLIPVLTARATTPLPYPEGPLDGEAIARQVYAAAHGGLVDNAVSVRNGPEVALIVNRAPTALRGPGRRPLVQTFETYVNSRPDDPAVDSMQMAILTSGKARGTGVLFVGYTDGERRATISMWLPALRKVRRINEPAHEDVWFGSNLTYGELVLRRPEDETHELVGEAVLEDCLPVMALEPWEQGRHTRDLPGPQCNHRGKAVYLVKSTTRFANWWYDHHVTEVDKTTFAPYRTVYYKDGEKVKTVVVDWQSLDQDDPRIIYPRFIYALTHTDGRDSMVYVPRSTISLNLDLPDDFWSEATLQRGGR